MLGNLDLMPRQNDRQPISSIPHPIHPQIFLASFFFLASPLTAPRSLGLLTRLPTA